MSLPPESGADSAVWLEAARRHLDSAGLEQLDVRHRCFHGQRAVEMALKATLIHHGIDFPKVHTLERLVLLLPGEVPEALRQSTGLTAYAVEEMYPDTFTVLDPDHAAEAVALAHTVVEWASSIIEAESAE